MCLPDLQQYHAQLTTHDGWEGSTSSSNPYIAVSYFDYLTEKWTDRELQVAMFVRPYVEGARVIESRTERVLARKLPTVPRRRRTIHGATRENLHNDS